MHRFVAILSIAFYWVSIPAWSAVTIQKPEGMDTPPAQIAASPSRIELEIGKKPANSSIKLFNLGDKPVTVSTSVHHWDLDEANKVRIIEPTPQSLDQWIIINPVKFTIPAGKSQTVRLSVRPRVVPEQGEHRGIVYFQQHLPKDASSASIRMTFRLGIVVYGLAGRILRSGELEKIRFTSRQDKGVLQFDVKSTGNAGIRLNGQYSLWRKADFPGADNVPQYNIDDKNEVRETVLQVGELPVLPVLSGTRRTLSSHIHLPSKEESYILFVRGKLGDNHFRKQFSFPGGP
jgi:fimbrial chaperone protein